MATFAELAAETRERPVPVVDLLRAWRHQGRYQEDRAALEALEGPETTSEPTDAWQMCLRALEHAFAPDELAHLTARWSEERQRPRLISTEARLRARLQRAAREGHYDVPDFEVS